LTLNFRLVKVSYHLESKIK